MDKKKMKNVAAAVFVVLALAVGTVAVYAFLYDRIEEKNQFHIGENSVEVKETFTEPETMLMENTFTKEIAVKNTGTSDQYVRVFLDFSDSSVRDRSTIVYTNRNNETQEKSWSDFLADLPEGWVYVPETASGEDAILGGYFYYTKILTPETPWIPETAAHHETQSTGTDTSTDHVSTPLILGIKTDFGDGTNPDQITDFDVIVYSESVQTVEPGTGQVYAPTEGHPDAWKDAWKAFLSRQP